MVNLRGPFLLPTVVAFLAAALITGEVEAGSLSGENGLGWAAAWSACDRSIGECLGGEEAEEMAMDSESNRRILQGSRDHIANRVLNANKTPCGFRGAPYSQCRPAAVGKPFPPRGCYATCIRGGGGD